MLLHSWGITLIVISLSSLFLAGGATRTAIRILRSWNPDADTATQIRLEKETWLSASLLEYGMVLQLLGLLLLVMAADSFSETLVGAMCATGAFLANPYGVPLLLVRLAGMFLYGFWILLHRLDISCENFPLTRTTSWYLLALLPLLLTDCTLLVLYLAGLQPEIITSCCGVIFAQPDGSGRNLVGPLPSSLVLWGYYGLAMVLAVLAVLLLRGAGRDEWRGERPVSLFFSILWLLFFAFSLLVITTVFSSYIYGMPFHRCPFDILKREYYCIGYPIYCSLFAATFFGISAGGLPLLQADKGLRLSIKIYRKAALRLCLLLLFIFLTLVSWSPARYLIYGGPPG